MKLTKVTKAYIDSLTYKEMFYQLAFAGKCNRWLEGETGEYWSKRMKSLRKMSPHHSHASKR